MTENRTDKIRRQEAPRRIPNLHGYVFSKGSFRHRFGDDFPIRRMDVDWEVETINAEHPEDRARLWLDLASVAPISGIRLAVSGGRIRTEEEERRYKIEERLHFHMTLIVCHAVTGRQACIMAGSPRAAREIVMGILEGEHPLKRYQWMLDQVREDAARVEAEIDAKDEARGGQGESGGGAKSAKKAKGGSSRNAEDDYHGDDAVRAAGIRRMHDETGYPE